MLARATSLVRAASGPACLAAHDKRTGHGTGDRVLLPVVVPRMLDARVCVACAWVRVSEYLGGLR
jgi:hypothetical protein